MCHARDREMGGKRPEAMNALLASVEAHLNAAWRLRLARDRWPQRMPEFRKYGDAMTMPFARLSRWKALEDSEVQAVFRIPQLLQ